MSKVYTRQQLDEIERCLATIQGCIQMGGLAPYQADVLARKVNEALSVLKKGKELDNRKALDALDDIKGVMDLFDEGYTYDAGFEETLDDDLNILEEYIKQ